MSKTVTLRLPFPPSLNRIWRAVAGRVVLSLLARDWLRAGGNVLPTGRVEPLRGRLHVTLYLSPPPRVAAGAWDIANREKLLCDLLTKQHVWLDDSQIDSMAILRGEPSADGYVDILINEQ
jgi:crossover junction endodeoxyribonuclease RusA